MKVGIVGAGTMGSGIAQVFAQSGYEVVLSSSSKESAQRGKDKIAKSLLGRVKKGKMTQEAADELLGRIAIGETADLRDCGLVVECIRERLADKQNLFVQLDSICGSDCLFATNTSSISLTEIGAVVGRPVIGMHFFNPAPAMALVEIIPGLNTPRDVVDRVTEIARSLGKTPVEVKDNAGFVVNRILIPMINEAIGLYAEGIASAEGIDNAMKLGANHPMGPLALGDLVGLDVCLAIMDVLHAETGDDKYRAHPLLRKMVRGGWLGKKVGKGFYIYDAEGVRPSNIGK